MVSSMRTPWLIKRGLILSCLIWTLVLPAFLAAEKNRDWKNGQILEPKPPYDRRIHTVEGVEKNYVVRGSFGEAEDTLVAGTPVKYALQGNTMYLLLNEKEYKLSVIGATLKAAAAPPNVPSAQPQAPEPPAAPVAPPVSARPSQPVVPLNVPVAASQPGATPVETLDNDAVVKMIVGGLKEDTVISVIQARPGKYALNPDAVNALKAAGIPSRVIDAMQAKTAAQH